MSAAVRSAALLALLPLSLAVAAGAGASSPEVHAARKCNLTSHEQRHSGASYVTSLNVKKTSCKNGKAVVRAYHKCRRAHGWKGKCGHKVKGYSCKRKYLATSPFQYDARVTCRRGAKRVVHTYTQNK
ncbi:MAG: hypothetical protein QOH76_2647 [Thermoleophilaceae bacterium]|jgi:hypothetical protein|nr:hypothetical protein [Thermoleophilaceae bacterium]